MNKLKHQLPYSLKYEVEHWNMSESGEFESSYLL